MLLQGRRWPLVLWASRFLFDPVLATCIRSGTLVYGPIRVSPLIFQCCHRFTSLFLFSPPLPSHLPFPSIPPPHFMISVVWQEEEIALGLSLSSWKWKWRGSFSHIQASTCTALYHIEYSSAQPILSAYWISSYLWKSLLSSMVPSPIPQEELIPPLFLWWFHTPLFQYLL